MPDPKRIPPLRMSIRHKQGGYHDVTINGTEFGWNMPKGGLVVEGYDRDRGVTKVTVTFLVDDLHVSNGMTDSVAGGDPGPLKALDALHQAGMVGADAITSLDTLIRRLVDKVSADVAKIGGDADAQHRNIAGIVGSDAIRAFAVLSAGGAR